MIDARMHLSMVIKMTARTNAIGFQIFASRMQHKQADGAILNT